MTDDGAGRLLRPLRTEPDGPPRYDVGRAMAEGRRRRGPRRWSGAVALVALTSVTAGGGTWAFAALRPQTPAPRPPVQTPVSPSVRAAAPAAPAVPKNCEVGLLPTAGVRKALVTSGDPSGRHLAGRLYDAAENVIVWKDGKIDVKVRMPGADATIYDLNRDGAGVGSSFPGERQQAYLYRDGTFTALDGRDTVAYGINDAGVAVGALGDILAPVPVRWASADAAVERLPLPDGATTGAARLIGEDGTVAGSVGTRSTQSSGYLWLPDGTGKPMPLPTVGGKKADLFWPVSIADGWVLGRAVFDSDPPAGAGGGKDGARDFAPLRYRLADGTYHPLPETVSVTGGRLADDGRVLGVVHPDRPVLVSGSAIVRLPLYKDFKEYEVSSLSADGRIAGGYTTDMGPEEVDNRPIRWTCE